MVHQSRPRPITFSFLARGSVRGDREGRSVCTAGGGLCRIFWENWETRVFGLWGNSDEMATPPRVRRGAFQSVVSRARSMKNILAGPDASDGPPEPSETVRMIVGVRLKNAAGFLSQQPASFVAELCQVFSKTRKPRFSGVPPIVAKSSPCCTSSPPLTEVLLASAREKNECDRAPTALMRLQSRPRPKTFVFLARGKTWLS